MICLKHVSLHSRALDFGLKAYSAVTKPLISRKNQNARLTLTGPKFTLVMKASLLYLGLMENMFNIVKSGKDKGW